MRLRVFADESGRPSTTPQKAKRRQRIFVLTGIVVDEDGENRLREDYYALLRRPIRVVEDSLSVGELFSLYRRATGRQPELKAGWLVNLHGPFSVLRDAPEDARRRFFIGLMDAALGAVTRHARYVYIVVIDKPHAFSIGEAIEERSGLGLNIRAFALDFLLTRLALLLEAEASGEVEVVHDDVSEKQLLLDFLTVARERGYIYNPRLRLKPEAYRRLTLLFADSRKEPLLQYADLVAYAARALRSGTLHPEEERVYRRHLCISRSRAKIFWITYPGARRGAR